MDVKDGDVNLLTFKAKQQQSQHFISIAS